MNSFAKHFRVLAPDLLGSGSSARPLDADYSPEGHLQRLEGLLGDEEVEGAGVVGNSYGGTLALLLAARYPRRVSRLVLVAPGVFVERLPILIRLLRCSAIGPLILRVPGGLAARLALRRAFADPSRISSESVHRYADQLADREARQCLRMTALALPTLNCHRLAEVLEEIRQPALVLWGQKDPILPPNQGEQLSLALHDSHLILIQHAGHVPQEEQPSAFLKLCLPFLLNVTGGHTEPEAVM